MIPGEFDSITKGDIDALITGSISEGRKIEYKEQLPGAADEDKREFLADASSFANAAGGDLIYGIREKKDSNGKPTGIPEVAEGLASINPDAEKRRLEDILRNGVDPRMPGVRLKHIDGFAVGPVIVLRVPKSWASPHMVTFRNLSRFFSRTSAGKHQLDVQEIGGAFKASGTMLESIREFRTERLGRIIADETPVRLNQGPRLIVHLVPLTFSDPSARIDLSRHLETLQRLPPIGSYGFGFRINFDGFLSHNLRAGKGPAATYLQVFRSGAFEAVSSDLLSQPNGEKLIPTVALERETLKAVQDYIGAADKIGIPTPLSLLVTLHGVNQYALAGVRSELMDRDTLILPEVVVEDFSTTVHAVLRPVFDAIWQAVGYPSCEHYNAQGMWDGQRHSQTAWTL
jgi:hypothetical protein